MYALIVTLYKTENCGSFLQAYALQKVLTQMGYQAFVFRRSPQETSIVRRNRRKMLVRKCLKLQIKSLRLLWKRINRFKRAQCYFHELSENDAAFANIDCVVVGSDTVWNFSMPYLDINKDIFLGTRFAGKRRVSYAASVANTPYAVLRGDPAIREGLRGFDAVSVRDAYSREIVEELTGRETAVTCDPTMLVERSVLDALAKPVAEKGYILLYHFGKISGILKKRILELKAASGKKVFSFGEYRGWCDKNLVYDPIDFVSYMKNADFVVTDTFHGTIFSILYEHPFADYGTKKKKIVDLLDAFGLSDALKAEEDSLLGTLGQPPDFTTAREKVKQDRAFSLAYLRGALEPKADAILQKPTTV